MAKLTLTTIGSGFNIITALNNNFTAIINAVENTLSLNGAVPNQMQADLDMNGNSLANSTGVVTGVETGTFATVLTDWVGFAGAGIGPTFTFSKVGPQVTIYGPTGGLTQTSDAITFTLNAAVLPANLFPTGTRKVMVGSLVDNGLEQIGSVKIFADGAMTFERYVDTPPIVVTPWTGSGSKGFLTTFHMSYSI